MGPLGKCLRFFTKYILPNSIPAVVACLGSLGLIIKLPEKIAPCLFGWQLCFWNLLILTFAVTLLQLIIKYLASRVNIFFAWLKKRIFSSFSKN